MARKTDSALQGMKTWVLKPAKFFKMIDDACELRRRHSDDPDYLIQPIYAWITPQIAGKILADRNNHNRNIRAKHVKRLAKDMKMGEWQVINSGLGFDMNGDLIDGQHRLHAIIECGERQKMGVFLGLDTEAMKGIDQNAKRSLSDVAGLVNGIDVSTQAGRIVNMFVEMATGSKGSDFTISERLRWYLAYQDSINFAAGRVLKHRARRGLSCTAVLTAIARAHAAGVDQEFLEAFYDDFYTMEGVSFRNSHLARKFRDDVLEHGAPKDKDKKRFIIKMERLIHLYVEDDLTRRKNFGTLRSLTYSIPSQLPDTVGDFEGIDDQDIDAMMMEEES